MRTTKLVVIDLEDGDEILVRCTRKGSEISEISEVVVEVDFDRGSGLIVNLPHGAEMISDPRPMEEDSLQEEPLPRNCSIFV